MPPAAIPISPEYVDFPTPQYVDKPGFGMQLILGAVGEGQGAEPEKEWDFANALALRPGSQAALLAGMYHLANAHTSERGDLDAWSCVALCLPLLPPRPQYSHRTRVSAHSMPRAIGSTSRSVPCSSPEEMQIVLRRFWAPILCFGLQRGGFLCSKIAIRRAPVLSGSRVTRTPSLSSSWELVRSPAVASGRLQRSIMA